MADWTDYKVEAEKRGALALELYVVESTPVNTGDEVKKVLPDHLDYQRKLEQSGQLALAGPMSDATGDLMQGVGLIIYRAQSLGDARALAMADPMHATGARSFTIRKWLVNEGSLTLSVGLSTGSVKLR